MIVALVGVFCFAVLLAMNWAIGRSLVYPGVALSGIWLLEFVVQIFARGVLYPVTWEALTIFVVGAVCFTAGAVIGNGGLHRVPPRSRLSADYRSDRAILWIFVVILIIGVPLYLDQVRAFTSATLFSPVFFVQVRQGFLQQAATLNRAPLVDNLVVLSSIAALVAYAMTDGARRSRVLVWGLVILAVFYNLLTASKAGAVTLVVALFAMHVVLRRRVPVRFLLLAFVAVLVLFGMVTVGRVEASGQHLTLLQSVAATWNEFLVYFSGGPVGFSIYLDHPDLVPAVWSPWRFFERSANYFGHYFDVPNPNAQFVDVGPGIPLNVYTAYFSYYPVYGLSGVVGFMLGLGWLSASIYRRALSGSLVWLVVYGVVFSGILMTIFSESLLSSLNFVIKLALIALIILGVRLIRFRRRSPALGNGLPHTVIAKDR